MDPDIHFNHYGQIHGEAEMMLTFILLVIIAVLLYVSCRVSTLLMSEKQKLEELERVEEAEKKAKEKNEKRKEKLDSGDSRTDFDNSIDILHELKQKRE